MLSEVALEGNDDLQAVVKRYAFLAVSYTHLDVYKRQRLFLLHDSAHKEAVYSRLLSSVHVFSVPGKNGLPQS